MSETTAQTVEGRAGRLWTVRQILYRPGHLRPEPVGEDLRILRNVDMVRDADAEVHGALRRFADRAERRAALSFLASGSPTTPVVLDVVDDPALPPAIVTSWVPGSSAEFLDRLTRYDDLGGVLDGGLRFTPAEALRTVVALGQLLDSVAAEGFTPIELSPDHLIYNRGSIRLVGVSRHLYRPAAKNLPDPCGMSLPTTMLLGDDYAGALANTAVWRKAQVRSLLRLVGWMVSGLAPAAWGPTTGDRGLAGYLRFAGFSEVPELRVGSLAAGLADASTREDRHDADRRVAGAAAVVFYDDQAGAARTETRFEWANGLRGSVVQATVTEVDEMYLTARVQTTGDDDWTVQVNLADTPLANAPPGTRLDLRSMYQAGQTLNLRIDSVKRVTNREWPAGRAAVVTTTGALAAARAQQARIEINPEAVRLGLMVEHGPDVVAIAAFESHKWTMPLPSLLSGAGWVLVDPSHLPAIGRRISRGNPDCRLVIAGRSPRLAAALGARAIDVVEPGAARPPSIASRPATDLPYLGDVSLDAFGADWYGERKTGRARRRRAFAAGWAMAFDRSPGRRNDRAKELEFLTDQFGTNTELLVAVRILLNGAGFGSYNTTALQKKIEVAAPLLASVPATGRFRRDLMAALLDRTPESLHDVVAARLLPVAQRLAAAYDPTLPLGGRLLDENLTDRAGIERMALFGRLVTALPEHGLANLAEIVSRLDGTLIAALADIPAPSLQHLVGRLRAHDLLTVLTPLVHSQDLDLLGRYTPATWEVLIEGLRHPEQIGNLGLGWALLVADDHSDRIDPRALIDLASATGREPRYVVRLLLDTPAERRAVVLEHRRLAAAWLREFDGIDIAPIVDRYPFAEQLVENVGARTLRNGFVAELEGDWLLACCRLAERLGLPAWDVVGALVRLPWTVQLLADATSEAGTAWLRYRLDSGDVLIDALRRLVDRPRELRIWAVDGRNLRRRVLTDTLGEPPADLGLDTAEQRTLFRLLGDVPGLAQLLRQVFFARGKLALLRIVADRPNDDVVGLLRHQPLHELMATDDPAAYVALMIDEGLSLNQARLVRRLRLDGSARTLLRSLGPLAEKLTAEQFTPLVRIAREHGASCAAATAVVAQQHPAAVEVVGGWGPVWLPLLAGPDGDPVARVLMRHLPDGDPAWYSSWLINAGVHGMRALDRHGNRLLSLLRDARPPANDVRIVETLLDQDGWPALQMYRLIVRYGLPLSCWPTLAGLLNAGMTEDDILLELWGSPLAASA